MANDVETEQVVDASGEWRGGAQKLASVVQVRGSIPIFWSQDEVTLTNPKPDITLQHFDPLFNATRLHFKVMRGDMHCLGSRCTCCSASVAKQREQFRGALQRDDSDNLG